MALHSCDRITGAIPAHTRIRPLLPFPDLVRCTDAGEKVSPGNTANNIVTNTNDITGIIFGYRRFLERIREGRISRTPTYSLSEVLARILATSEKEPEWQDAEVPLSATQLKRFGISDLTFLSGKMLRECSSQSIARISSPYLKRLPTLGVIDSNGNCLIRAGFYPRIESEYTLSDVLQSNVPEAFFLSEKSIERMVKHGYTRVLVLGR